MDIVKRWSCGANRAIIFQSKAGHIGEHYNFFCFRNITKIWKTLTNRRWKIKSSQRKVWGKTFSGCLRVLPSCRSANFLAKRLLKTLWNTSINTARCLKKMRIFYYTKTNVTCTVSRCFNLYTAGNRCLIYNLVNFCPEKYCELTITHLKIEMLIVSRSEQINISLAWLWQPTHDDVRAAIQATAAFLIYKFFENI